MTAVSGQSERTRAAGASSVGVAAPKLRYERLVIAAIALFVAVRLYVAANWPLNFDELLVAYKDRSASIGETLPEDPFAALSSVVVRNGRAVALWRRELGKQAVKVAVQGAREGDDLLDRALAAYGRFLERPIQRWQQGVPGER